MSYTDFKNRISNFINLFIPTSKTLREDFYTTIAHENYIRLFFISAFYFLFELRVQINSPPNNSVFLDRVSIFILCLHFIAVIFSLLILKNRKMYNGVLSQWIISSYCVALLFWSVNVTLTHIFRPGGMTMFIITLVGTSAIFFRRTLITLLTNIGYYFYFAYRMKFVVEPPSFRPPEALNAPPINRLFITNALLVTGLCCILGVIVFRLRLRVFLENKALENLATKDTMTGVMNHKTICDSLKMEVQRSHRYALPLSILIIDIDHFKSINDTYGHQFGDEVIMQVAALKILLYLLLNNKTPQIINAYTFL